MYGYPMVMAAMHSDQEFVGNVKVSMEGRIDSSDDHTACPCDRTICPCDHTVHRTRPTLRTCAVGRKVLTHEDVVCSDRPCRSQNGDCKLTCIDLMGDSSTVPFMSLSDTKCTLQQISTNLCPIWKQHEPRCGGGASRRAWRIARDLCLNVESDGSNSPNCQQELTEEQSTAAAQCNPQDPEATVHDVAILDVQRRLAFVKSDPSVMSPSAGSQGHNAVQKEVSIRSVDSYNAVASDADMGVDTPPMELAIPPEESTGIVDATPTSASKAESIIAEQVNENARLQALLRARDAQITELEVRLRRANIVQNSNVTFSNANEHIVSELTQQLADGQRDVNITLVDDTTVTGISNTCIPLETHQEPYGAVVPGLSKEGRRRVRSLDDEELNVTRRHAPASFQSRRIFDNDHQVVSVPMMNGIDSHAMRAVCRQTEMKASAGSVIRTRAKSSPPATSFRWAPGIVQVPSCQVVAPENQMLTSTCLPNTQNRSTSEQSRYVTMLTGNQRLESKPRAHRASMSTTPGLPTILPQQTPYFSSVVVPLGCKNTPLAAGSICHTRDAAFPMGPSPPYLKPIRSDHGIGKGSTVSTGRPRQLISSGFPVLGSWSGSLASPTTSPAMLPNSGRSSGIGSGCHVVPPVVRRRGSLSSLVVPSSGINTCTAVRPLRSLPVHSQW